MSHEDDNIREDAATVLERETESAIAKWLERVEEVPDVISVKLSRAERCAHLPAMFADLVHRLRDPLPLGTRALMSDAAIDHGAKRLEQGYIPAMMVEESRMLQVTIFETLQEHLAEVSSKSLLLDVMAIADEVDSQLAQALTSFIVEGAEAGEPVEA